MSMRRPNVRRSIERIKLTLSVGVMRTAVSTVRVWRYLRPPHHHPPTPS